MTTNLATYGYSDFEAAACNVRVLIVVLLVTIVAYAMKSRLAFVLGTLGSTLPYLGPKPKIYASGTVEGIWMANIEFVAQHYLMTALLGAAVGITVAATISRIYKRVDFETSDDT